MAKFIVTLVRVEHAIYRINVEAEDQEQAEELAQEKWNEGEIDLDTGEVVHGEDFINQVDEIEGKL
jgi:predicted transcriptional regulator